jgi:hypothetical protein
MRFSYLEAIASRNPDAEFDDTWTLESIQLTEIDRCIYNFLVAQVAASYRHWERHPEKTFRYRALDVKWSRRIMYAYSRTLWQSYGMVVPQHGLEPSPAQRVAGASVVWPDWWRGHRPWLQERAASVANWALECNDSRESRSLVQGLEDEHDRLVAAFRGIDGLSRELSRLNQVYPRSRRGRR